MDCGDNPEHDPCYLFCKGNLWFRFVARIKQVCVYAKWIDLNGKNSLHGCQQRMESEILSERKDFQLQNSLFLSQYVPVKPLVAEKIFLGLFSEPYIVTLNAVHIPAQFWKRNSVSSRIIFQQLPK